MHCMVDEPTLNAYIVSAFPVYIYATVYATVNVKEFMAMNHLKASNSRDTNGVDCTDLSDKGQHKQVDMVS